MTKLAWGQVGEKKWETGVSHGVLYKTDQAGAYADGVAWNGLTAVTESPSGAESNKQYADNQVYANLLSAEEFSGTIEAFYSPEEFDECDGQATPSPGVLVGQQPRKNFGLAWRSEIGNDVNSKLGYKLHLLYNGLAAPSEKAHNTINDSPELQTLSWEVSTTPVDAGPGLEPTSKLTIDSTQVDSAKLALLEDKLYGTAGTNPQLPTPAEVIAIFEGGTPTTATPVQPTYNSTTKVITIPTTTGVDYKIDGEVVTGSVTITEDTMVTADPKQGYKFPAVIDRDWFFDF
ncbi:major tail protein [Arthrobacter phage NapoleonB]|uniref:Major tail protein n=1 Tax=Arthrobacter phage Dynamite TaxID=2867479 RepID=A0AAE8XJG1_9CAUD|nr:major tail protein [Arthrobacter phage Dynamite]QFP94983.1 major tail protein [Arthrobacter phage NapoleonB]UAW09176.1 major tail protein [Arthrobacter phage Dynamite]